MANIEATDAAGKIDIPVAVDVFDGCTIRTRRENWDGVGGTARDGCFAARHERARTRTWDFCSNLNRSHFLFLFSLAAGHTIAGVPNVNTSRWAFRRD